MVEKKTTTVTDHVNQLLSEKFIQQTEKLLEDEEPQMSCLKRISSEFAAESINICRGEL